MHRNEQVLVQDNERMHREMRRLEERVALLEKENTALAGRLRELGVDVRLGTSRAEELPQPLQAPAPSVVENRALMKPAEQRLLDEVVGRETVIMLVRSMTTTDTGGWFFPGRIWACATERQLILIAAGRHPLMQVVPFIHINASQYNQVTGALVLAPNREFTVASVAMDPADGYQFLSQIFAGSHETGG